MANLKNLTIEEKIKTSELNNDSGFALASNVPTIEQFNELKAEVNNLNGVIIYDKNDSEKNFGFVNGITASQTPQLIGLKLNYDYLKIYVQFGYGTAHYELNLVEAVKHQSENNYVFASSCRITDPHAAEVELISVSLVDLSKTIFWHYTTGYFKDSWHGCRENSDFYIFKIEGYKK